MFKTSESELSQLVRIAWELGLAVGNRNPGNEYEVLFNAMSAHLHATGWSLQKGSWNKDLPDRKVTWTQERCSPLFPQSIHYLKMDLPLDALIDNAVDEDAPASTVVPCEICIGENAESRWHLLVRVTAFPDGNVECVSFVKPAQATAFTELERAFVDAMLANLSDLPEQENNDASEMLARTGLPKRQREVLELLLKGASLKEIASELRISRHTVNDYSKSLYRHFDVSGRAELAAIFRHSGQLELSHAE